MWRVAVEYYKDWDEDGMKQVDTYNAHCEADMEINKEALNHHVHRKADLRPLRQMRKQLDTFEDLCVKALAEVEEYNAKSKEST